MAKGEEMEYTNVYGETVKYVFIKAIQSLHLWDKYLQTGTEVHYRFLYTPNKLSREDFLSQQYPEETRLPVGPMDESVQKMW